MHQLQSARSALLLLALLLLSAQGFAWSRYGHETVGHLAEKDLSPAARMAVSDLLDGQTLADVGSWADQVRPDRPETFPLHFVNGPLDDIVPSDADLNLPQGTVYTAVLGYSRILADTANARADRVEALKFLVHFLADLHQPLHSGFLEDRGGNDEPVIYRGEVSNLHRYWDNAIFAERQVGFDARELAAVLRSQYGQHDRRAWAMSSPREWVIEAREFIFSGLYPRRRSGVLSDLPSTDIPAGLEEPIAVMDESYRLVWQPVAELQLARAGARLAATLNAIFDSGQSPFPAPAIPFPPSVTESAN
jgi:hypothetical protein